MLRAILVDDESNVLLGLRHLVDWEAQGFMIAGTFQDAGEALEAIRLERPELVITDIEMPHLSGLDLIRAMRSEVPDGIVAVLSAYDEFRYAQEAIRLGVSRYLLKPLSPEELTEFLAEVRAHFEENADTPSRRTDNAPAAADNDVPYVSGFSHPVIPKAKAYIDEHFSDAGFRLADVADALFVNYSYLSALFRQETGISLIHYLLDLRMQRADQLLRDPSRSVAEIGQLCGYPNTKTFHTAFKNYYHESPRSYRMRILKIARPEGAPDQETGNDDLS